MTHAPLGTVLRQIRGLVRGDPAEDTSDCELLERFLARREEAAFVALLRRHGPMVLQVCRRVQGNLHDAEDVFQATFLLLARKAATIRKHGSVASWLHGVAHRLALEAKGQGARRQERERRAADMRRTATASDRAWQDLQATLDEALGQVPETYRTPLLLCYLQGKTQEEASQQIGCPLGTVRSRLARGRDRLRAILERRGVRLSATAMVAALAASQAPPTVAAPLLRGTARAALEYAAGQAAAGLVSARAVALLEGGTKVMATAKLKIATGILLLVGAGAAVLATQVWAGPAGDREAAASAVSLLGEEAPPVGDTPPAAPGQSREPDPATTLRGVVRGVDGKALAGAKLLLVGNEGDPVKMGTSAADGSFAVPVPKDLKGHYLIARAEGLGLDFTSLEKRKPADLIELRLVPDLAVHGRVIDTQGKPVAGVRVSVQHLNVYADNSLDTFLAAWKRRHFMSGLPGGVNHLWRAPGAYFTATTNADGRFTLTGLGAERMAALRLSGAGIADVEVFVCTRAGFDPKPYNQATRDNIPKGYENFSPMWLLYGPEPSIVAEAEKPIRGVVMARDSHKPRAGVEVQLTRNGNELASVIVSAKTDAQGRYEIHGARKDNRGYMVEVAPDVMSGYLPCQMLAGDTPGYQPVTIDLRVVKGVVIAGRVLDRATGKPVPGFAMAAVLSDNPYVKDYPDFNSSIWIRSEDTQPDGSFRAVTIPGPVLLMGGSDYRRLSGGALEGLKYQPPRPDPRYPKYFSKKDPNIYYTSGGAISIIQGQFCKVLQIKPGTEVVHEDVLLEPASALPVKIRDADGHPLRQTWVTGMSPQDWHYPLQVESDACSAYQVEPGKPRLLAFYHPARKLVGTLTVKAEDKGPAVVKLTASGQARGRLVDGSGHALTGYVIELYYNARPVQEIFEHIHRASPRVVTDATGSFQVENLIPGADFRLYYHRARSGAMQAQKVSEKSFRVKPAEALNLGELRTPGAPKIGG